MDLGVSVDLMVGVFQRHWWLRVKLDRLLSGLGSINGFLNASVDWIDYLILCVSMDFVFRDVPMD